MVRAAAADTSTSRAQARPPTGLGLSRFLVPHAVSRPSEALCVVLLESFWEDRLKGGTQVPKCALLYLVGEP